VFGLVLVILIITLSLIPLTIDLLQTLPRPDDERGQVRVYHQFRQRMMQVVPVEFVAVVERYLPADAKESQAFQYVQRTLKGPYVTEAVVQLAWLGHNWFWQWVLIMFILWFLLMEGPMLTRRVVEIFGPIDEVQAAVARALAEMAESVRIYLVWRTIINIALGFGLGVYYQWLGLKQPWTWAFLTGVLLYIPYLGALAGSVLPILDAFLTVSPRDSLTLAVVYLVVMMAEGYLIVPLVMGRRMELNATTVMLACLFWERIWGLPGLFLAMPLMAAIKAVCYHVPEWRPWANLMGTRLPLIRHQRAAGAAPASPAEETQVLMPEEIAALQAEQAGRAETESP
jgi:predicted PurR-regulated permease PerM